MPIVSIIIPTYNRAQLIGRAIKSVIGQTFINFELIVIDDCSLDNTEQVISALKDERIRYLKHENNKGQNPARNTGVLAAKGQYLAFLDSDDEWVPEFLEKMFSVFNQDQSLGAVYSRAFGCSSNGDLYDGYKFHLQGDVYKDALEQGYLSYMITIMVKKDIIDLLLPSPFDPNISYGDDDDFCFRVAKICRVGLIKEPLAIIHNDGAITGSEPSICQNTILIAEGRYKLLEKFQGDILKYCGRKVLASKYFSLAKLFLINGNIEMAKFAFEFSFRTKKNFSSFFYLLYLHIPFLREKRKEAKDIYRFLKKWGKRYRSNYGVFKKDGIR